MNQTMQHDNFRISKQKSVDILFKGLKRKVDQRSYSKLKASYKKKPSQTHQLQAPFASSTLGRSKLKLSVVSNNIVDIEQAHQQLLKLKQANHKISQQNSQLLRKIRKQVKIQQIYRKKLQGKQLIDLDYFKVMEVKLLLEVERLENQLEDRERLYHDKVLLMKARKHLYKGEITDRRIQLYQFVIDTHDELAKTLKDKKTLLSQKDQSIDQLNVNLSKIKSSRQQKSQTLKKIQTQIKQLKQKFKTVQAQTKREKNNSQMLNITNLMSNLISSQKPIKQASTVTLKNNMSSISVKNKSNVEEIEKEVEKVKQECQMINNQIQEFMDEMIRRKILVHKQINEMEERERRQREVENRNVIAQNGALRKQAKTTSRVERSKNKLKSTIVIQ